MSERHAAAPPLRSQLGRARGLGAAHSGLSTWWAERVTSVALVPLTVWFVVCALHLLGAPQAAVRGFVAAPWNTVLLLALVGITFWHTALGLQVVIEDYVHRETTKIAAILAVKAGCVLLALTAFVSILKLAF